MKKLNRFLYLLALLKFTLPFFLQNAVYEPHRDEFLYLAEGAHPAFGFMEVPPLLSGFSWLTQHLGKKMFLFKNLPAFFSVVLSSAFLFAYIFYFNPIFWRSFFIRLLPLD